MCIRDRCRHDGHITSVCFSPDGKRIVTGSQDKTSKVWDVVTGNELATLRGHAGFVMAVSFSPDGTRIVTGSLDSTAKLWDATTGTELATLRGHSAVVKSVSFSPDGTRIATASLDRTIKLWHAATGVELATLRGDSAGATSVSFSPDGTRLASGLSDRTARLWDSVPCRIRCQQRQAMLAARPQAERIVDALWERSNEWKSVAQRLREDASLSEPVRRAALNSVLRRVAAGQPGENPPE